jgi:hypothetical protein
LIRYENITPIEKASKSEVQAAHNSKSLNTISTLRDLGRFAKIKAGRPYASFGARL